MDTVNRRQRTTINQTASMGPGLRRDDEGGSEPSKKPVIPAQAGMTNVR